MLPNYPDPLVVQVMRENKAALLAQEDSTMRAMAERWVRMENALVAQMNAVASEIQKSLAVGQVPTAQLLRQYERYSSLVYQAHAEMRQFIEYASSTISQSQEQLAGLGIDHAAQAIRSVYSQAGLIGEYFNILPRDAVQTMIGLAGNGTPLDQYLRRIYGDATDGLTQALIDGLAKGLHPVEVAKQMRDGFGMGLNHALNTARTETLRAYREASLDQYRSSGVVSGWKRLASHDGNTCAGCLFTEGEFYANEAAFQEHNQGRCTMVPVVEGVPEPTWVSGKDWFLQQSDETQATILGQGSFDAWKGGVSLDQMVTRVYDPVWGASFIPTPAGQLVNSGL